jgi:hypothetical protein
MAEKVENLLISTSVANHSKIPNDMNASVLQKDADSPSAAKPDA